jgi:predicted GNAT family acetyltransferase
MDNTIKHDSGSNRFNTVVDDVTGYVEYELNDHTMTITHTIVPPSIGGRGIAGALVKAALDHARAQGWQVVPECTYADGWMRKHAEYENLRV